jgi:acyl-CoA thioesterase
MSSHHLEEQSQSLEMRMAALEAELKQMKQILLRQENSPWWLKVAGSFEDDPTFDEAVQLGQEWRYSGDESNLDE